MPNMSLIKNNMPVQDPVERSKNFNEVALGYTVEQAIDEAKRCLTCPTKPCISGCPVKKHIPDFIKEVANGNFELAYQILSKDTCLPAVCGRVCPQENQCESKCVRGIKGEPVAIGRLERFVADYHNNNAQEETFNVISNGHKVAVIGSGPSGLACAGYLAKNGYEVTIFEALHVAGGVLVYGIPEFRLPKSIVQKEIESLKKMGVKIQLNAVVGKSFTIDELTNEYGFEAVFIGTGAGLPKFMGIKGENSNGVYSANEFLTRVNLMKAFRDDSSTPVQKPKNVVVFGGGNVAMDAARSAKRLGADVSIVYRRTEIELPARKEEIEHAKEEGIKFNFLLSPVEIVADQDGWAKQIICQQMKLSEPDQSGRAKPVAIEGEFVTFDVDCIIVAIGTSPNPLIKSTTNGLDTQSWGGIVADDTGKTSIKGVYAGGDAVTGAATVILAMGAGKTSAMAIDEYIKNKK